MRRALLDLTESNKRLANQRKAMLHILADLRAGPPAAGRQTDDFDNSRRGPFCIFLRIAQGQAASGSQPQGDDSHHGETCRRPRPRCGGASTSWRDKQEQLVQAGKLPSWRAHHRRRPRAQQPPEQHRLVRGQRDRPQSSSAGRTGADRPRAASGHAAVRKARRSSRTCARSGRAARRTTGSSGRGPRGSTSLATAQLLQHEG